MRTLAVEQGEYLRCHGRGIALLAGNVGHRLVKNLKHGIDESANLGSVNGAPIALLACGRWFVGWRESAHDVARLERGFQIDLRENRRAPHRAAQFAGHLHQAVPERGCPQPQQRASRREGSQFPERRPVWASLRTRTSAFLLAWRFVDRWPSA